MIPRIALKNADVKWEVIPEIEAVQDIIMAAYLDVKSKAIVTSAHDGDHSFHSAHHQNNYTALSQAIDVRTLNLFRDMNFSSGIGLWYAALTNFAVNLTTRLNGYAKEKNMNGKFFIVLEKDHIHLEFAYTGKLPNIQAFVNGQYVYHTKQVREYMA